MRVSDPAILHIVLAHYPKVITDLRWNPLGSAGGFSGANLWCGSIASTPTFCLKGWPVGYSRDRLQQIHKWMKTAQLPFVPQIISALSGESAIEVGDRVWDLSTWMPGKADFHVQPSPQKLRSACEVLAALHQAWYLAQPDTQPCPGVLRRLSILELFQKRLDATDFQPVMLRLTQSEYSVNKLTQIITTNIPRLIRELLRWKQAPVFVMPCICDLWHDHVLFTGEQVTGIIDYGAMKIDHPAVDLARMLGDFTHSDPDQIRAGLGYYQSATRFPMISVELTILLDQTGVLCAVLHWLQQFKPHQSIPELVQERWNRLIMRLEKLSL